MRTDLTDRWPRRAARTAALGALAAAVALSVGCGSDEGGAPSARTVVAVEHLARDRWTYARARFNEMCAGCHTLADAGARGPRFDLDVIGDITEQRARAVIAEGEPGMPGWRDVLSKREFEELVAYVSTVERQARGDDRWSWQMRLRMEGEGWTPEDRR